MFNISQSNNYFIVIKHSHKYTGQDKNPIP